MIVPSPSPPAFSPCSDGLPVHDVAKPTALTQPTYPIDAREIHASGIVHVVVSLAGSGTVLSTKIGTSSGNPSLDRAGIAAASESEYAPAREKCAAVPGTYLFTAEFRR